MLVGGHLFCYLVCSNKLWMSKWNLFSCPPDSHALSPVSVGCPLPYGAAGGSTPAGNSIQLALTDDCWVVSDCLVWRVALLSASLSISFVALDFLSSSLIVSFSQTSLRFYLYNRIRRFFFTCITSCTNLFCFFFLPPPLLLYLSLTVSYHPCRCHCMAGLSVVS